MSLDEWFLGGGGTGTDLHLQFDYQIFEISVSNREKQDEG